LQDFKNERKKLQTEWKLFEQKVCSKCTMDLTLPTYYFMCGHVYHEGCVIERGEQKECLVCYHEMDEISSINLNLKDPQV